MKLLATRDMNLNDPLPNLGKALPRPTPATRPARETRSETNPDIIIRPDGKMETAIPGNAKAFRFSSSETSILQNLPKEVEPRQVKVGVRILTMQVVNRVNNSGRGISIGDWSFSAPDCEGDQTTLITEFAE